MSDFTRINKFLAHSTGISRREADEAVLRGRVTVNGVTAEMGAHVAPTDAIALDGRPVGKQRAYTYLMFNKPIGYACSRKRQGDTRTIYELLPENYRFLKPVGRLDKDSSGLLLLTDDGDFAHQMTHPKFYKTKVYKVELDKPLEPLHQQMISDYGIQLEDGNSKFLVSRVEGGRSKMEDGETWKNQPDTTSAEHLQPESVPSHAQDGPDAKPSSTSTYVGDFYQITMNEGRNRQIRRTFASLGYLVTKLHRTQFGSYNLGDLAPGAYTPAPVKA